MTKRIAFTLAVVVGLTLVFAGLAAAQTKPGPSLTSNQPGLGQGKKTGPPPPLCPPSGTLSCLFYGGDGDPTSGNANGLWDNNNSYFGINGVIYTPFTAPAKTDKCGGKCDWGISGLFQADQMYPYPPTVDSVAWSIVSGVAAGGTPAGTTVLCSGTDSTPALLDTGRLYFGFYEEYDVVAHVSGCPTLEGAKGGTEYWETVQVNTSIYQLAYASNVPDAVPPNAYGPAEPVDQSFFFAPSFGFSTFTNTNTLGYFHLFSSGVEGALTK